MIRNRLDSGAKRVCAALEGRRASLAAGVAYPEIPFVETAEEHTDEPWWILQEADPERCLPVIRAFLEGIGCDWWGVSRTGPHAERAQERYVRENGQDYRIDRRTGKRELLFRAGRPRPQGSSSPRRSTEPPTEEACLARFERVSSETMIAEGRWDFAQAQAETLGARFFLYGYTSTPFVLSFGRGFEETLMAVHADPGFLDRMAARALENQRELFRAMAAIGLHGVWMQDMYAGRELLGRAQYRDIVLPWGRKLVRAAQAEGLRVIHYFMGDVRDRLDLVLGMGADILLLEEGRKGYGTDLETLGSDLPGGGPVLMGNLPAEAVLERGSGETVRSAVQRLARWGRRRGRFVFGTGAPPTPATPLARIRLALQTAREAWEQEMPAPGNVGGPIRETPACLSARGSTGFETRSGETRDGGA